VRRLAAFDRLAGHEVVIYRDTTADPELLRQRLDGIDAVVLNAQRTSLPGEVIAAVDLKLISQTGRNTAHIDMAAATAKGVLVCLAGTGPPSVVAELTWALILSSRRCIPQEVEALRAGRWQTTLGHSLAGKTLGILAFGRIGGLVAGIGKAFGMRVLCWGREGSMERARLAGYDVAASREAFFAESDVLSLHLALNAETRGSIGAHDLGRMKPDALLVNTSRAQIIAPGALAAALARGRPGFAAVDVFDEEPVPPGGEPLVGMPNVLATPHIGAAVYDQYEDVYGRAFEQIIAFAAGAPINVANPQALDRVGSRDHQHQPGQ
jgi:D-3-phosphoglycerate dehydrogenase